MNARTSRSAVHIGAQRGAVLVTSLLMLLVMTMIGITAMRSTSLEEKMSGNSLSRDMAFQSAEIGLRAGENLLYTMRSTNTALLTQFDSSCTVGLCDATATAFSHNDSSWVNSSGAYLSTIRTVAGNTTVGNTNPAYALQHLTRPDSDSLEAGRQFPMPYYSILARGVGGTTDAVVVLQSVYKIH